ncbi:MAG: tetratricopeptide repeat protein [Fibrobacterales bacterium]
MTKKSSVILLSTSLLLIACSGFLNDDDSSTPDTKVEAKAAFEQQDYPTAIQQYNNAYTVDSTDKEAYIGLIESYVEQVNPDSLIDTLSSMLTQETPNPVQAVALYYQIKGSGLFDSLATLEGLTTNSPAFDSLTVEERANIEAIRIAAASAGAADQIITEVMNNDELMSKVLSGNIDETFIFELIDSQDTSLVESFMELFQDSTLSIPGIPELTAP